MIYWLQQFLRDAYVLKVPMVFGYSSTRILLAAITSLLLTILLGPLFMKKMRSFSVGQSIRTEDCPPLAGKHGEKRDTPTMGGILILFAMLVSMGLWMDLSHIFTLILLITTLFLGGLGFADDYLKLLKKNSKGVRARVKLLCQICLGALVACYLLVPSISEWMHMGGLFTPPLIKEAGNSPVSLEDFATRFYMPFFKGYLAHMPAFLAALFCIFVVTGSSNAVNLTDGLDGLAAGCLILVAATLGLFAFLANNLELSKYLNILYIEGAGEIAIFMSAFVGACIGFLWYNGYPADLFMGDTGSLSLGGIIGVAAILLKREMLLGIVGGIFVIEALSVILQVVSYRYRNKKRVFLCAPIHHHFEFLGWSEPKVVFRFWIVGLVLAIIGVASLKFQ